VRESDGCLRGVEAVIDKDLGAALLADAIQADRLVIATDVEHAVLDFGTDRAQPIETVDLATMRTYAAAGQFGSGSMGPKVEAICRYVERAGQPGVITSLANLGAGVRGEAGTIVVPDGEP
jgi:carbamate kinase